MSDEILQIINKTKTYFLISFIANFVFALALIIIYGTAKRAARAQIITGNIISFVLGIINIFQPG
jgi:hypothetical protein